MGKLHEVLAVERDLENQKKQILLETKKVLGEHHLFSGTKKTLKMFDAQRTKEEAGQGADMQVTTDVITRLKYTFPFMAKHLDCVFQKEITNTKAKADIVIGGVVLLEGVPATMLLALEREFVSYREVLKAIPTTQAGIKWEKDETLEGNVLKTAEPVITQKVEKEIEYRVVVAPTDKHPAQVKEVPITHQVGDYTEWKWTGCITPAKKAEIFNKLECFIQAVKSARAKANSQEVEKTASTRKIFEWLLE